MFRRALKTLQRAKKSTAIRFLAGSSAAGGALYFGAAPLRVNKKDWRHRPPQKKPKSKHPADECFPIISLEEVRKHVTEESVWVTYKGYVYDITEFQKGHPGLTTRLMMAAGNDLEPYFDVYKQHYRGHIIPWFQRFKIGKLSSEDAIKARTSTFFENPYDDEPWEDRQNLLPTQMHPFNGEPKLDVLTEHFLTPNRYHYVRNHLIVPDCDAEDYEIEIDGAGVQPTTLTLNDLKTKFKQYDIVSTMKCAGDRREDFHGMDGRQVFIAPHWVAGAISCAEWTGVRLRDVLKHCGLDVEGIASGKVDKSPFANIAFEGNDYDETGVHFGGSFPIEKAVDPLGDVILAFKMNGEELPRDHGYPVRAIVPGHAGARQVKWLRGITVSESECKKSFHECAYRGFAPDITFEDDLFRWLGSEKVILDQAKIVQELPVSSIICNPTAGAVLSGAPGEVEVRGVAWSGGGSGINRVDVSTDGGRHFTAAKLHQPEAIKKKESFKKHWAWTHFSKKIPLSDKQKAALARGETVRLELTSKAVSAEFNVQPERPEPYYNARGVCLNHWYRVPVTVDPKAYPTAWWQHKKDKAGQSYPNKPSGGKFKEDWLTNKKEVN